MTYHLIPSAGCVVCDQQGIHGAGIDADQAWHDFKAQMTIANITVLLNDIDTHDIDTHDTDTYDMVSYTRFSDYRCFPATAALMAQVEAEGGAIAWGYINKIACTVAEEDEANQGIDA